MQQDLLKEQNMNEVLTPRRLPPDHLNKVWKHADLSTCWAFLRKRFLPPPLVFVF